MRKASALQDYQLMCSNLMNYLPFFRSRRENSWPKIYGFVIITERSVAVPCNAMQL